MDARLGPVSWIGSLVVASMAGLAGLDVARADEPATPPPAGAPAAEGQPAAAPSPFDDISFEKGPVEGKLESRATIKVPEGMVFIGGRDNLRKFVAATQNLSSGKEVGVVLPATEGESWWLLFEFDAVGYVKDDEGGSLDGDALLEAMKEGTEQGNAQRQQRGFPTLQVTGWHTPPRYNPQTHNLEWAARLMSTDGESLNYNIRLLGRAGVMSATLIASPTAIDAILPKLRGLLEGFAFLPEESYAAFKEGDRMADYGLAALVTGGVIAAAAKSGLLGKFWKILAALGAAIVAGLGKLFGRKKSQEPAEPTA